MVAPRPVHNPPSNLGPAPEEVIPVSATRGILLGFFISGILLSFLGAILPAWAFHLRPSYFWAGNYFLGLNAGLLISVPLAQRMLRSGNLRATLAFSAGLAAASFFYLSTAGPPLHDWWRMAGIVCIGLSGGILNAGLFRAISPLYRRDPAATVNLSGLSFGIGSLVATLLVAGAFYIYTTGAILFFLGVFPSFVCAHYARTHFPTDPRHPESAPLRQAIYDFQSPAAVLFALLLFFQFGNEWAIAGWLPLFLVQRLGISPATSLMLLAFYWLALLTGRILAQALLPRINHGKLLAGSVVSAIFGCLILSLTNNLFGAAAACLMVGAGFASIYPLVVERIGARFPYYHPGVFNGLFSIAVTGGLLAPASLGYIAEFIGIGVIMLAPLAGSMAVLVLLVVIWIEARLSS